MRTHDVRSFNVARARLADTLLDHVQQHILPEVLLRHLQVRDDVQERRQDLAADLANPRKALRQLLKHLQDGDLVRPLD